MPRLSRTSSRTPPTGQPASPPTRRPVGAPSGTPTANRDAGAEMKRGLLFAAPLACVLAAAVFGSPAPAQEAPPPPCLGDPSADGVVAKPGPRLRFGITPAGEAGAVGPPVPVTPGTKAETLAALRRLRPPGRPVGLRLKRFFWLLGAPGGPGGLRPARGSAKPGD